MNLRAWLSGISFTVLSFGVAHQIHRHDVKFLSSPPCGLEGECFSPFISLLFSLGVSIREFPSLLSSLVSSSLSAQWFCCWLWEGFRNLLESNCSPCNGVSSSCLPKSVILRKNWVKTWERMCSDRFLNKSVSTWRSCTKDLFFAFIQSGFWNKKTSDCQFGGISMIIQLFITHPFLPKMISCLKFLLLFY